MNADVTTLCPLFQVYDMPASIRFYSDVLGFEVVENSPVIEGPDGPFFNWAWLRKGGAELMLNTAYEEDSRPEKPDAARWSGHRDAALFIGAPNIDAVYESLVKKGLEIDPPRVAPYGMKQLYLSDPDGYGICFQWKA